MKSCGLYIHIPFCNSKCPYCSFYSVTCKSSVNEYINACIEEVKSVKKYAPFDTVYIGGGTPSSLPTMEVNRLLEAIVKYTGFSSGEFTIEVNPESVTKEFSIIIKNSPVNRISMGVQSFDEDALKLLGRSHKSTDAIKAYDLLRNCGIENINMDFMYDIPQISAKIIEKSLCQAILMAPQHISAYSYMPDTGYLTENASDDPAQSTVVSDILKRSGYMRYEVSNYAKKGFESVHNKKYWEMKNYIGIGAGAHSMLNMRNAEYIKRLRYCHTPDIKSYIKNPLSMDYEEYIEGEDMALESLIFRLRLIEPFNIKKLEKNFGNLPSSIYIKLDKLINENFLEKKDDNIVITIKGLNVLDSVMEFLI